MVEVKRRRVVDVLRILPVRHQADENGHLDASAAMRRAQKRADLLWIERVKLGFGWAYGVPRISRPSSAGRAARGAHRRACCKALDTVHAAVL